jgi:hypothetical protein
MQSAITHYLTEAAVFDWVVPVAPPEVPAADSAEAFGGGQVLLVDRQVHAERAETFLHVAHRVLSEAGLQALSKLEIEFDPGYQTVFVHGIEVIRDGSRQSRMRLDRFTVVAMERDQERSIYNGTMQAVLHFEDIRVGDTIEYAYSMRGDHPVYRGVAWACIPLGYATPVGLLHHRLLASSGRPIVLKAHAGAPPPETHDLGGQREWVWRLSNLKGCSLEDRVPGWCLPFPFYQVSDRDSWSAVSAWARGLFPEPESSDFLLESRVHQLLRAFGTPEERTIAALRFVQGEVRYLAFPEGSSPHRAKSPENVLHQRYGDCKDKSWLLCNLLRRMGIDAVPALVNSRLGRNIEALTPTIHAFNHCIVRVTVNGRRRWCDPTLPRQGGRYDSVSIPDFGLALEVADGVASLAEVDGSPPSTSTTVESFELCPTSSSVQLNVETVYSGLAADMHRHLLAAQGAAAIGQQFQSFYASHFGELETGRPIAVSDDTEKNTLAIQESYRIADPWKADEADSDMKQLRVLAHSLFPELPLPAVIQRAFPFALGPPVEIVYRAEVHGAALPPADEERLTIDGPGLRFERRIAQEGGVLIFTCRLVRQEDHVQPSSLESYMAALKGIGENAGFSFWRRLKLHSEQPAARPFPWWLLLLLFMVLPVLLNQCPR